MKKLLLKLFFLFLIVIQSQAQNNPIEKSTNKIAVIETVSTEQWDSVEIYNRIKGWMIEKKLSILEDSINKSLLSKNSFFVYNKGPFSKTLHGKIHYSLLIEIKNKRYRYTISNFVFHYYKQNRNYAFVPTGKTKPLEEKSAPGWGKLWEDHKKNMQTEIQKLIADLKKNHFCNSKTI